MMSRSAWCRSVPFVAALLMAACGTPPPVPADNYEEPQPPYEPPARMIEYPPIEPVEPPLAPAEPVAAAPAAVPAPAEAAPVAAPPPSPPPVPEAPALELPPELVEVVSLLADLQRFSAMNGDDVKREITAANQALTRQRTDANRVRLAMLFTHSHTQQDDQRALQLLDNVAKSGPGSPAVKQLGAVLQAQVAERVRAVRDEQQKADAAVQKLEALRAMERSLLRDRVRSGGGGAGGGGGSGN